MSKYDVEIDLDSLNSTTEKISKNLLKIEEIINNVNDAYLSLDDSKWIGNDKKNLDISLGNYLEKMTNFSDDLKNTLNVLTTGLSKYDDIDQEIEDLDNVEDL